MQRSPLLLFVILGLGACSLPPVDSAGFQRHTEVQRKYWEDDYRIRPTDGLRIDIYPPISETVVGDLEGDPMPQGLSEVGTTKLEVIVQKDGRIILPRAGGIHQAEGKTCASLAKSLADTLRTAVRGMDKVKVSVQVTESADWEVFVDGEVFTPGALTFLPDSRFGRRSQNPGGFGSPVTGITFSSFERTRTETRRRSRLISTSSPPVMFETSSSFPVMWFVSSQHASRERAAGCSNIYETSYLWA